MVVAKEVSTGQYAGFHLLEPKARCGWQCFTTQILVWQFARWEKAEMEGDSPFAKQLLSQLGFFHIDTNQRMQDRFTQAQDDICQVELANFRTRLQTLAGTDNPYALLDRRGYTLQVAGAAAYIIKCAAHNATRADYGNCTIEVPVKLGDELKFADPFTCLLYTSPSPRDRG